MLQGELEISLQVTSEFFKKNVLFGILTDLVRIVEVLCVTCFHVSFSSGNLLKRLEFHLKCQKTSLGKFEVCSMSVGSS